jgi:hypothetical protein
MYDTLGNGGIMYRVFDNTEKKELRVITPEPLSENNLENANNVNHNAESELDDWVDDPFRYKSSEIRIPYKRVWIAHDPEYSLYGFEILAEIACYEDICSYVFIGPTVTFFWTSQPIEIYHSYVENNGVPYGFAATKDYIYGFTHTEDDQVIVVSRKRIEKRLRKNTGKSLNDELEVGDMWEVTDEIMKLPFATVHQETLHDNFDADDYEPFDQGRFQEIMESTKQLSRRRSNYGNTAIALGSKIPMNVAREIAEFRTGLAYRPYKKNTMRNSVPTNIKALGLLPNNFHEGNNASSNNNDSNRGSNNGSNNGTVPAANTKSSKGKFTIMGGRRTRKRTYKRRTHRRNTRR